MKGLLIKDLRFLMNQKSSMIIFLGLGLFFMISARDVSLALAYTTMMVAIFATSSISYDGFNNGMAFLMTLPVQRKAYAISKYIFSLVMVLVMGVLISAIALVANVLGYEIGMSGLAGGLGISVALAMAIASLTIPIYLKFGAEKSRYAMAIIVGVVFALSFVLQRMLGDTLVGMVDALNQLRELPTAQAVGVMVGGTVAVVVISMLISIRVVEKKEY